MENWWRLTFEPTLSIARKAGVAKVTQLVKGDLETALPQFMRGVLAMVNKSDEHPAYNGPVIAGGAEIAGTHESGQIGWWWFLPVSPEEIDEYVL